MATPIGSQARLRGFLYPAGDTDLYSFTGAAGDRVYIATMTSASPGSADTEIVLLDRDGTTGLEGDDENGVFGSSASSIAGATLPGAGTYFIRVTGGAGPSNVRPYDLYFRRQSVASVAEVEPNDTTATAQAFPASGFVDGTLASITDQDHYSISLNAGDTVFLSLDLRSTSGGTPTSGRLGLGRIANSFLLVNDNGVTDNVPSQALFITVQAAGTYFISVDFGGGGSLIGSYRLSATVFPREPAGVSCTTYTSTDVPKIIPAGPGQVTSTIDVPGNPIVADLSVTLGMTHVHPLDVDVELTAPGGNTAVLFTDVGSATYPDLDVTLNQAAGLPIGTFSLISGQVSQPEAAYRLHWFDGQPAGGAWTLTVVDDSGANGGGTLNNWALEVCEPAPATCPSGNPPATVASFDFEAGASGFTHSGTQDAWALGTPTFAPITNCNGGTQCWKTNLAGPYPVSFQTLVSPVIDLATATPPIFVSWAMKYQMGSAPFDRAWVDIENSDGTNVQRLWEWRDGDMAETVGTATQVREAAGWGTTVADVSAYAGGAVRLVFHLDSALTGQFAGLAIDDVSVKHCPSVCGNGVVEPGEQCDLGATNGASDTCCTLSCQFRAGGASIICRAATNACDATEFCTGSSGDCPADAAEPDGTSCNNVCTQSATCQGGVCTGAVARNCDDNNPCTTDTCDPATGCQHSGTCAPDGGGGADGGGGGGNGSCGCTAPGAGAELAALHVLGVLLVALRRAHRKR